MVDDWITHTPKDILAKNFGVNASVFDNVPTADPYILPAKVSEKNVTDGPAGTLSGDNSFVYRTLQHEPEKIGGTGGEFYKIDSTNFPIAKTLAATFVRLKPGGLRELHWHPNVSFSHPLKSLRLIYERRRSGYTSIKGKVELRSSSDLQPLEHLI